MGVIGKCFVKPYCIQPQGTLFILPWPGCLAQLSGRARLDAKATFIGCSFMNNLTTKEQHGYS